MGPVYCDNCGTSLLEETAKFCRACGKPTPESEAATKRFDQQPGVQVPTKPVGPSMTAPAYMAPFEVGPAVRTSDLREKTQKRNIIILASMLVLMVLALGGLLAFLNFGGGSGGGGTVPPQMPVAGAPAAPSAPSIPSIPPQIPTPPAPPAPPFVDGSSSIDSSLIYPGARVTTSVNQEGGKSVLQMQSTASVQKVADWYTARLKGAKKVTIVGQTILKAGDVAVLIMGGEEGTQIIVTRGGGED